MGERSVGWDWVGWVILGGLGLGLGGWLVGWGWEGLGGLMGMGGFGGWVGWLGRVGWGREVWVRLVGVGWVS